MGLPATATRRPFSDAGVVALAGAAVLGARVAPGGPLVPLLPAVVAAAVAWATGRRAALVVAVGVLALALGGRCADGLRVPATGAWDGWATLVGDPVPAPAGGVRVDLRVQGKHVRALAHARAAGALERRTAGERVRIRGTLRPAPVPVPGWMRARHVAGRMTVHEVGDHRAGAVPWRVAGAFRRVLLRGAEGLGATQRSLFAGFVLGDARGQPDTVADDFRASGLGHLLVVSGQNVAFVLAAVGPLLRRLRLRERFIAGAGVLLLFGTAVRWEPSVLRACAMAAVVLYAQLLGRPVSSLRVLGLAVTALVLVDPALAFSTGFGLSVSACVGIALLAAPLAAVLPGPRWLAGPLSTTLAAQVGTAPLLVGGLGGVPLVAPLANLLALPAAEPVTVWGLVAGLPAGVVGGDVARALHVPTGLLVSWVAAVARFAGSLPLGALGAPEAVTAAAAVTVASWSRRRAARRWCAAVAVVACAFPMAKALVPPEADAVAVARGATLWRAPGGPGPRPAVLVLEQVDGEHLLRGLRERGVRGVSVLVVTRSSPAFARAVVAVLPRLSPRLIVAPDGRLVGVARTPVVVADAPVAVRSGALLVQTFPVPTRRLDVRVGPPQSPAAPVRDPPPHRGDRR